MTPPVDRRPPLAVALEWVSRITAVAGAMVLPGLLGYWVDHKLGTGFLAPAGFVIGVVGGIWSLLALTGAVGKPRGKEKPKRSSKDHESQS
jgi:hypothetical protein